MSARSHCLWLLTLFAFTLSLLPVPATAQTTFGSVEGSVIDQSEARVPGAVITITNLQTNLRRIVISADRGFYRAPNLPVGTYRIKAQMAGFATVEAETRLDINQTGVVNLFLKVAGPEEIITVTSGGLRANTVTSDLGQVIDNKRVLDLPLNGRSFDQLVALAPGAIDGGSRGYAVNGSRPGGNNFLLNGTDANNNYFPENVNGRSGITFTSLGSSSLENIEEFRIVTNTYSAEYGRTAGAQINVVTKSGTNQLHGSAFEFFRDAPLQARDYFSDRTQPKPDFRRNQYGGSLGGPIIRDRTFFFTSYEGLRERVPQTSKGTVPNDAFRQRTPAVFQPFLKYIPLPNQAKLNPNGTEDPFVGFISVSKPQITREDTVSGHIDHEFSQKDSLSGHYQFDDGTLSRAGLLNELVTSRQYSRNQLANITHNHIFSGAMLNELRLGVNRGTRKFFNDPFGVTGYPSDLVSATVTGLNSDIGNTGGHSYYPTTTYQAVNNLSWNRRAHRLKFGTDIRHVGEVFDNGGTKTVNYLSFQDFFNNKPDKVTLRSDNPSKSFGITNTHFYVQDDIRVAKKLNVNLGLRYEYNSPASERHLRQSSYNVSTRTLEVGQPLYHSDKNNFAPRIGFAWDVSGDSKTVVRSGYGIFYDSLNPTQFIFQSVNPPFAPTITVVRGLNPDLTYPLPATYNQSQLTSTVYGFDPDVVQPMVQQFNLNVQRQLGADTVFEIGYVGSRSGHLLRNRDINRVDPDLKSRPDPRYASIIIRETSAQGWYHSFQVNLNRRFRKGLASQISYTWGHMTDDASSSYDTGQNMNWLKGDYGNSDFDRRHNLVANFIYELPVGRNHAVGAGWNSLLNAFAGGWQVNGIAVYRTALPFTLRPGKDARGDGSVSTQRADVVSGISPYVPNPSPDLYLNRAAFVVPTTGQYGNLGRNTLRGPDFRLVDLSIFKNFRSARFGNEKNLLQFRAEVFNLFNHPNLGTPDANLSSSTFGRISSTVGYLSFTNPTGSTMRQIQLALKFIF